MVCEVRILTFDQFRELVTEAFDAKPLCILPDPIWIRTAAAAFEPFYTT